MNRISPTLRYLIAVTIYGTIGFFLHFTNVTTEFVVICRGFIGSLFISAVMMIKKDYLDLQAIKKNFLMIACSGIALGLNWVFLFSGYKYSMAISGLLNNMAPIIVVIISAIFLREKLNIKQNICILLSVIGAIFVSGVFDGENAVDYHSVMYGLLAAVCFVAIVLCNKRIKDIKPLDKTITQLFISAFTVFPYVISNRLYPTSIDTRSLLIIILLGIVHTGIAYILYFNSIDVLDSDKIAIISYIEPVLSILIGTIIFKERLTILGIVGAVMILFSALANELIGRKG